MKEVSVYFLAPMWSTAVQITANPPAAHLQSSVPVYFIAGEFGSVTGPGQFSLNLRVSKSIGIGPRSEGASSGGFNGPPPGGGRGPGGGGPPGGGLGPGGLSSSGGRPPSLDQQVPRRYSLNFTAVGRNIFNNVNLAPPVGVLESPLFGKSNALAGGFFSSPSSNRSIDLQVSFNF